MSLLLCLLANIGSYHAISYTITNYACFILFLHTSAIFHSCYNKPLFTVMNTGATISIIIEFTTLTMTNLLFTIRNREPTIVNHELIMCNNYNQGYLYNHEELNNR